MNKIFNSIFIALMITTLTALPASAQQGKINLNGGVIAIDVDGRTLTVESKKGELLVVTMPDNFDMHTIAVGDSVLIKAHHEGGGQSSTILADSIKHVGARAERGDIKYQHLPEGSKDNSAYCGGQVQDKSHPLAENIAARNSMTAEEFMLYFCDGYSTGAIMLALKTSELDGSGDPRALLTLRAQGKPWEHAIAHPFSRR
jgi:hypothetical protein